MHLLGAKQAGAGKLQGPRHVVGVFGGVAKVNAIARVIGDPGDNGPQCGLFQREFPGVS